MNTGLMVAALLCLMTWGVHTFLGGRTVARPLLHSQMEAVALYTNYYCWHIVTLVLLAMTGGYAYAALNDGGRDVAILCTALSVAFTLWSWGLILLSKRSPWSCHSGPFSWSYPRQGFGDCGGRLNPPPMATRFGGSLCRTRRLIS